MNFRKIVKSALIASCVWGSSAWAELDPELAQTSVKNNKGLYIGAGLRAGQSYGTGGSNPGTAVFAAVEPGYVATRDSWGRLETSLQLSTGMLDYKRKNDAKSKVTLSVPAMLLARVGYGWSLGYGLFSVVRVGAGPAFSNYKEEANGDSLKSDGLVSGLGAQLAWELISPVNDLIDVVGGIELTHLAFNVDQLKLNGSSVSEERTVNVNMLAAYIGLRMTF